MSALVCGILHDLEHWPRDKDGCRLADGHNGPHEFVDQHSAVWCWETNWECDCDHCMAFNGDYCTIYWPKK